MTLEEFYQELLKDKSVKDDEAKALYEALAAYRDEIARLTASKAPRMMHKDHENLFRMFSAAYDRSVSMSRQLGENTPKFLSECIERFGNQYTIIKTITDKKEHTTLDYAYSLETNRIMEGQISDKSVVKGNQSERFVVNGVDRSGKVITGLFTVGKRFSYKTSGRFITTADSLNGRTLGLPEGERIDSRNTAMSDVANLLGRDDLLAKSTEMKYSDGNKEVSGTFMNFSDATDLSKISSDKRERYYNVNVKDPYTARAKKDAIDLTIIDYLCGNVDRHAGNLMYRYKKCSDGSVRLNGIVGIDNDCSFGTKEIPDDNPKVRLQALDDTVVISQSMADKLSRITPEILSATLKKNDICQASIDRAVERLTKLKTRIEAGKKLSNLLKNEEDTPDYKKKKASFLSDPVGSVKLTMKDYYKRNKKKLDPLIVVLQDKDFDKLNIDSIAKHAAMHPDQLENVGVCNMICTTHEKDEIQRTRSSAADKEKRERKRPPKVKLSNKNICHYSKEMADIFSKIKKSNTTNPEYKEFIDSITETQIACEEVAKAKKPDIEAVNRIEKCLEKLKVAGNKYKELNKLVSAPVSKETEKIKNRINLIDKTLGDAEKMFGKFAEYKEKFIVSEREEKLIADDKLALTANNKEEKEIPSGTIEKSELKIGFNELFGNKYAGDLAVRSWKSKLEKKHGKLDDNWEKYVTDFDFPAKNEATNEFVVQLQNDCDKLYSNYKAVLKTDPVDIDKWNKIITPLADNLKINLDQYNQATDFMYFDDPKMHALSSFITAVQSKSEKAADKAVENIKNNKEINTADPDKEGFTVIEDNRLEKLHNKLRYYSFNINNGAEKHSNSKEFIKMKDALDRCANAETLSSTMLDDLSKASGEYLTKKTSGVHVRAFADPIREFRLDLAKTIKQIADANIERVKTLPGAQLENNVQNKEKEQVLNI